MIPCKNCLLIPACKFKPYYKLLQECDLIYKYSRSNPDKNDHKCSQSSRIMDIDIEKVLHPTRWRIPNTKVIEVRIHENSM